MNNQDFRQHFISACRQIGIVNYQSITYTILPVREEGRNYNSTDDILRLWLLPGRRRCTFEQSVKLFTWKEGYYPLWISISADDGEVILKTSLRLRKAGQNNRGMYPFILEHHADGS